MDFTEETQETARQRGSLAALEPKAELLSELEFGRDETATKRGAPRRAETRGVEEEKDTYLFAEKSLTAFLGLLEHLGGEWRV